MSTWSHIYYSSAQNLRKLHLLQQIMHDILHIDGNLKVQSLGKINKTVLQHHLSITRLKSSKDLVIKLMLVTQELGCVWPYENIYDMF